MEENFSHKEVGVSSSLTITSRFYWLCNSVGQSTSLSRKKSRVRTPSQPPNLCFNWKIAQLVEQSLDRGSVKSSSLFFPTRFIWLSSLMVEHFPVTEGDDGSNPF